MASLFFGPIALMLEVRVLRVYNTSGQLVLNIIPQDNQEQISGLKPGAYIIHFDHEGGREVRRLIIN